MEDEPFSCSECMLTTYEYLQAQKKSWAEWLNPPDAIKEANNRICKLCFEVGATKRRCCNQLYCDHCYTKDQKCPYCKASTRVEKMTGATFAVDSFSEAEECRCCLEPGTKRRCCGNYYCDDCYYKVPLCRSCDEPTGKRPDGKGIVRGTVISIVISWLTTILFCAAFIAAVMILSANEAQTKVLMSGYKCYGYFKDCTVDICADMSPEVAMGSAAVPPLANWRKCTIDSKVKLINKACVFDQQLFDSTDGFMGFDICMDKFHNGVFVFEDTFEEYRNASFRSNELVSGPWSNIRNGHATSYCGVAEHLGGRNALTFSGEEDRFAETTDLDIAVGGWLEAELLLAPVGFDVTNPKCKSSYAGSIDVEYSIDGGVSWTEMAHFDAWRWRQEKFFYQRFPVPTGSRGATAATRFRFIQRSFSAARDHWALDNVRVLRFLPLDWHENKGFAANKAVTEAKMQRAQCCFDTDWCETRLTETQMDNCRYDYEWYKGRHYFLRGAELFVVITIFLCLFKWVYVSCAEYFLRNRYPFQDEYEDLAKVDWLMEYIPKRYRPKKNLASMVSDIHMSARLAAELSDVFRDDEGEGEAVKNEEDLEKERKEAKAKRRKEKKRLKERMKNKNFKASSLGATKVAVMDSDSDSDEHEEQKEGSSILEMPTGLDETFDVEAAAVMKPKSSDGLIDMKRTNVGMLRIPFDTRVNWNFVNVYRNCVLCVFGVLVLIKLGTTTYYVVHQPYTAYGQYPGDFSLTSMGLFFFACVCDAKEIYYVLKKVIPCTKDWVPMVTIDLQEEISSLFIGPHTIELSQISEITAFSDTFCYLLIGGFSLGAFPWCIFSVILRDQFLEFDAMRIVTPTLGAIMCARAILGPAFVVKIIFSLGYLFSYDPKQRERFGAALQEDKSAMIGFWTAVSMSLLVYFIAGIVLFQLADLLATLALAFGLLYGIFTGCIHSLPIRPWMYLTMVRGGVWMKVRKKQRCPCIYWGSFCTEMHDMDEVFILWTTDQVKFLNLLKGGITNRDA